MQQGEELSSVPTKLEFDITSLEKYLKVQLPKLFKDSIQSWLHQTINSRSPQINVQFFRYLTPLYVVSSSQTVYTWHNLVYILPSVCTCANIIVGMDNPIQPICWRSETERCVCCAKSLRATTWARRTRWVCGGVIWPNVIYVPQVDREYHVISALHRVGFPVPQPLLLCNDASVIGTAFYLMEYVKVIIVAIITIHNVVSI